MFYNFADIQIPFEEFKLDNQKLTEYRQRLLAVDSGLCISEEEHEVEDPDDNWDLHDLFIISWDSGKVAVLAANDIALDLPSIYILSDAGDYKLTSKEMFETLTQICENQPARRLTNLIYGKDKLYISFLIEGISAYLNDLCDSPAEQDHYFFTNRSFCDSEGELIHMLSAVNPNEVLRLLRIILATVYNYREPYKFTKDDLRWL